MLLLVLVVLMNVDVLLVVVVLLVAVVLPVDIANGDALGCGAAQFPFTDSGSGL